MLPQYETIGFGKNMSINAMEIFKSNMPIY